MNYLPSSELPTLAHRIVYAMSQRGMTQQQLADAVGTSQTTIQKLCSGKTKESRKLPAIARILNVWIGWLETGEMPPASITTANPQIKGPSLDGQPIALEPLHPWDSSTPLDGDEVELPLFKEVELASGDGRTVVREDTGRKLRFSRATLRTCGVEPENAVFATNCGNSNYPLILHGSTVGIDKGMTRVIDGEIYALDHDGLLRVKFLQRIPGGGLRLRSFNHDEYKDEDYNFDQIMEQRIRILGRVFWWSTIRPLKSPPLL